MTNGNITTTIRMSSATPWAAVPITWGGSKLEFPTSSTLKSFGLRPSAFIDVGSVWKLTTPLTDDIIKFCTAAGQPTQEITPALANRSCTQFNTGTVTGYSDAPTNAIPGFRERFEQYVI